MAPDAGTETFFPVAIREPTLTDRPDLFLGTSDCEDADCGSDPRGKSMHMHGKIRVKVWTLLAEHDREHPSMMAVLKPSAMRCSSWGTVAVADTALLQLKS